MSVRIKVCRKSAMPISEALRRAGSDGRKSGSSEYHRDRRPFRLLDFGTKPNRSAVVDCHAALDIPLSTTTVWGQLRDFRRYARQDFFHAELTMDGEIAKAGARLTMRHRYAGISIVRVGRILIWREGVGYSFSDLSRRGPRAGFPHIFSFRLASTGENSCRLTIRVRGLWTANWIPKWIARLWLWWVFSHIVRRIDNELMIYRIWRNQNIKPK